MTAVLSNVVWVPYSKALLKTAEADYEKRLYNDKGCSRCEYLSERHCDVCDTCPAFLGHFKLWSKRKTKDGRKFIGFPTGDRRLLRSTLKTHDLRPKDRRVRTPMKHAIKFTGSFRPGQKQSVRTVVKKGYGLLEAPPRSGKTVMSTAAICDLGMKTIVLASQTEWLKGFLDTIVGNKQTGVKPVTNANDFGGNGKVVGFAKTLDDFHRYDICLVTYQTFLSEKGKLLLKAAAKMFGTVVVDEADKVAAKCFLSVINKFRAAARFGVTGTPDRKDGREVLTNYVLGPVVHAMEVETLVPVVRMVETKVKLPRKYKLWTAFETALVEHADRNRLILKMALADVQAGRFVVIPVTRVHHALALTKALNRMAGESVAAHFIGAQTKAERETIIEKAQNGLIKCVIGMRQLLQRGINVPVWDMLYEVMPISNPPNFKQETSRVRTTNPGKPQPIIRHFIDDDPMARGCLRTCYWQTYRAEGFDVGRRDLEVINRYTAKGAVAEGKMRQIIKF